MKSTATAALHVLGLMLVCCGIGHEATTAQSVNEGYRRIAEQDPLVYYVDVAGPMLDPDGNVMTDIFVSDNLHLNRLGNAIWGATIKAALMPVEGRFEASLTQ